MSDGGAADRGVSRLPARPGSAGGGRGGILRPRGSVGLLVGMATGVALLVIVAVVVGFITSSWQVAPVAALLELILLIGLVVYVYWLIRDTRDWALAGLSADGVWPEPKLHLGDAVGSERVSDALVAALRDVHAEQLGTRRFLDAFRARVQTEQAQAADLLEIIAAQREQAEGDIACLQVRLKALGAAPSRIADEEAAVGVWLFERLLADGVVSNARHAFALAELASVSYTVAERLAGFTKDRETRQLMARCAEQAQAIAARWRDAWDTVLDLHVATAGANGAAATLELLEQAQSTEEMRSSLLTLTNAHERSVGNVAGAEDAGLGQLLWLSEQEYADAEEHRRALRKRSMQLGGRHFRLQSWGTLAAARTTALAETSRGFKIVRDARDLIAAEHLETATYELLERAARRAGDEETARLARRLSDREREGLTQLQEHLDETLEVALLAGD